MLRGWGVVKIAPFDGRQELEVLREP